jgi:hypothetical protein
MACRLAFQTTGDVVVAVCDQVHEVRRVAGLSHRGLRLPLGHVLVVPAMVGGDAEAPCGVTSTVGTRNRPSPLGRISDGENSGAGGRVD